MAARRQRFRRRKRPHLTPVKRRLCRAASFFDAAGNSMRRTVRIAAEMLPQLVATARRAHRGEAEIRTAVLMAWTALAGVIGWSPAMVRAVEREMSK